MKNDLKTRTMNNTTEQFNDFARKNRKTLTPTLS